MKVRLAILCATGAAVAGLCGCETLRVITKVGTGMAVATGRLTPEQAASVEKASEAVGRTFETLTPEQEYYIGRSVAAAILGLYRPYANEAATRYVNHVGAAVALASDAPETFGGYHFLVLDTDEINAFAAPGGFILVSRGLLRCCGSEDEVAAVLAHEVAHVQHKHGLRAIKKGRLTTAVTVAAAEGAKTFGGRELAELTAAFEGTVSDITATLVNSGYSRALEYEADRTAVAILDRAGYNPAALLDLLGEIGRRTGSRGRGFARTHPAPDARVRELGRIGGNRLLAAAPAARAARFNRAMAGV